MKTTAAYIGTHSYEVGNEILANSERVTVTEISPTIVYFSPSVDLDEHNCVTVEAAPEEPEP